MLRLAPQTRSGRSASSDATGPSLLNALTSLCAQCAETVPLLALTCPSCGATLHDDEDPAPVSLLSQSASEKRGGKNLCKLLASLDALERGDTTFEDAGTVVKPILASFRKWLQQMTLNQDSLETDDEHQMFVDYSGLASRTIPLLEAYHHALESKDCVRARHEMLSIEEELVLLKDLREHYQSLGFDT